MSAVDVRAVLNEAAKLWRRERFRGDAERTELAITAFDELVDALRLCRDELAGIDGHIADPDNPDGWTDADLYAAYAKAGAALANIGAAP